MKLQFDRELQTDRNRECITGVIFYFCKITGNSISTYGRLFPANPGGLCDLTEKFFENGN